jgi:NADH:ubiquinone oxidoreductase subunit F (NADH-binding)
VVALGEGASIRDVVRTLLAFNARESCGKCTPCREGTARLLDWLDGRRPEAGVSKDRVPADLRDLAEVVRAASLCGLGQAAPLSLLSALDSLPEEMWNGE